MSHQPIPRRFLTLVVCSLILAGLWISGVFLHQSTTPRPHAGTTARDSGVNVQKAETMLSQADDLPTGAPAPQDGLPAAQSEPNAPDVASAIPQAHPSAGLIAASRLVSERWSQPDAVGNRGRAAIYRNDSFKYPLLRVVESWSGKTGDMASRLVMVADHLLVAPRAGVDAAGFRQRLSASGFTPGEAVGKSGLLVSFETRGDNPAELPKMADQLAALDDIVDYAEPDYVVWPCLEPNDSAFLNNKLWGLRNTGGVSGYTQGADIDAASAWAVRNDASGIVVAVTDTGIRLDHQDLAPNLWRNAGEISGDGFDNDGNGIIDDVFGYNAIANNGNPMDDQGHGTHCAGTIGARGNNGTGMTGVAWNVQLLAGKFLGPFGGTTSDAVKVIDYSRQNGAGVISASWGGGGFSVTLRNAIAACAESGIPFVAAAGNSGTDNDSLPHYPSSYDLPNIVAVAATDATDSLTGFSCFGESSVDIAAPGWQIWSSYNGGTADYRFLHGTSMATPHVSGALALAKAHFPDAGVEELIDRLCRSADKLASLNGKVATGGRLNLYRLLTESAPYLPNDSFDAAHVLAGNHAAWSGSNRDATRDPDESSYSPASETRTVWFAWQAPSDGFCKVSAQSLGAGQRVLVFKGETRATLQVVYDSGTASAGMPLTSCSFLAESGQPYRIVTASNSARGELFGLTLELVPANDLLSRPHLLEGEAFEFAGSNRGATAQPFETSAPHAGVGAGHSLWFRWTAPFSGEFTLNTEGSSTDTVLAVYTGDPANPAGFVSIGSNDDVSATLRWSRVNFTAEQGVSYHIALDTAMGGQPGSFILRGTAPAVPVITNQPQAQQAPFGGRAVFSVGADGTAPLRYQWFRNDEALPGAWENTLIINPVTSASLGAYHVVVSNSYGSVASAAAHLSEKRIAPTITWSSGDLAAAAGSYAELRVEARGSQPLTYQWRRNGEVINGANGAALALTPLAAGQEGPYSCTVSNDAGQAVATMRVTVVSTPFAAVQWRLPEMPGPSVTDMKVIDGKLYAVTGDRIMVSTDGTQWSTWLLPAGFEGRSMNKLGTLWLCVGMNASGNGRCATSTNGTTWTLSTPTGLPGDGVSFPLQHVRNIEVFNGRFIGQRANKASLFGDVYTSTNGIAWTAATLDGSSSTTVVANGPFAMGPGMMIAGATNSVINKARAFRTTDGANWTSFELPAPGDVYPNSLGATRWNNKFVLFKNSSNGWISDDGINWTLQTGKSWPGGLDFNGQFVSLGGTVNDGISVTWGSDPWTSTQTFMKPATGDFISAYRVFNGRVVYGTQRGFLGSMTEQTDFQPFGGSIIVPNQVAFLDNRFFVFKNETYGSRNGSPLVSGDGGTWRKMRPWTWSSQNRIEAYPVAGFGGGRFWGAHDSTSGPAQGLLPHVMSEFPTTNGLPNTVNTLAADGGTLLAIASAKLYRSSNSGDSWAEVTGAPVIGTSTIKPTASVTRSGSRWLLTNAAPDYSYTFGYVHYSDNDGVTWTKTNGKAGWVVPFNGGLYGLENLSSSTGNVQGWKSTTNGSSWTTVAFHTTNKLANVTVLRLGTFGGYLVALVNDSSYVKSVWFSSDGVSWFNSNLPSDIVDFATGLNQFVAYTSTGAIIQAGSPTAGGAAPIVRTDYPLHQSAAVAGSWMDVTGEAVDPEGGAITLECRVDGQLIGTSGAGAFRFRFRAMNPSGHTIILRATDAHGLVGSDELRVTALPPQGENLLATGEGRDFLPKVALVEFNGAYYTASGTGMLRSTDGENWEPVLLPSLSSKLKGLAAGNGSLVAQTEWGSLYTTRDGVNWVQVGDDTYAGFWIYQPITFSGGRFLIVQQIAGQQAVNYRTSVNGIDWQSASLYTTSSKAVIGDNGVMVSIHEDAWTGDKAVWSQDGGNNWTAIPGISRTSGQSLGFAVAYGDGVFLIAATDGRVWRSGNGKTWTMSNLPSATSGITVRHAGGRFFVGSSTQLLFSAPATLTGAWQSLSIPLRPGAVIHALGRYVAQADGGMVWSRNGVSWKWAEDGPLLSIGNRISSNGERLLVIDDNGAAWSSSNGTKWRQDFAGSTALAATSSQVGSQMAALGSKILLAGSNGMLASSTADAASWTPSTADGQAIPNTWHFNRVQSAAGTALATAAIGTTAERVVLRSVDGVNWQSVTALASQRIMDVAGNGSGTWLAAGANAAIFRSTDHGVTWQQVTITGIATARAVVWFNNQWLLFGAASSGAASSCWRSTDGISWTAPAANGLATSGNEFFRTEGHGRLVVWNRTDKPVISSDGITWQPFNGYQTYVSNSLYWVAPTSTGFLLSTPYQSAQAPVQMFEGSANGQSWVEVPRYQNDTVWGSTYQGRLFLFAPGRMVEWSLMDLELELTPPSMTTMGVGDAVQSPAVLRNPGSVAFANGVLDVDGWLSADGFFGDGNDVYLGRIQITAPAIAPGGEAAINLTFRLPGRIRPGDSRLVVALDPERKLVEKNRANNVSISSGPVARVPQRKLGVLANGNGTVSADQNAEYYPHGARIALVATPGKGARFAGWGGDAVGSLSETLVIMDSDKNIEAEFVSTAALTVFTRGGGTVTQSADDGIYTTGSTAQLSAVPLPGWTFSGWSGTLSGSNPAESLLMDANKVVTARFSLGLNDWKNQHFSASQLINPAISGDAADADGDGLQNWREWLRGSDPQNRASRGQGEMRREGDWVVITYDRLENMPTGHAVRASASTDLADWSLPLDERVIGSANGVETIEARIDVSGMAGVFLRIGDTRTAP